MSKPKAMIESLEDEEIVAVVRTPHTFSFPIHLDEDRPTVAFSAGFAGVMLSNKTDQDVRAEILLKFYSDGSTKPDFCTKAAVITQGQDESQMEFQTRIEDYIQTFAKEASNCSVPVEFTYVPAGQDVPTTLAFLQRLDVISFKELAKEKCSGND